MMNKISLFILILFISIISFISNLTFVLADEVSQKQAMADKTPGALVVLIYDETCKTACEKVRPLMKELGYKFGERIKYVELNTAEHASNDSMKRAKELGVSTFYADSTDVVPIVGIFNAKHKKVKELPGVKAKEVYGSAISDALKI